jgi:hypothetical protein
MGKRERTIAMKSLPVLFATALLSVGAAACGTSDKSTVLPSASSTHTVEIEGSESTIPTHTTPAPVETKVDADKDNDGGAPYDDTNNDTSLNFGHEANAQETQAVTAAVKHYYAVALAENGAAGCQLLYSSFAESIAEDYGKAPPGQPYMRGTTCPAVMTLLYKHFHPQLALELPLLKVARVQLEQHHGVAVLRFGKLAEREISVGREGHVWKIEALLDRPLP